jgi:release factor glutamine methyltransferase
MPGGNSGGAAGAAPRASNLAPRDLSLRDALREAERILAAAGVATPRVDAELLAGHLMGLGRAEVRAAEILGRCAPAHLMDLVVERARRIPLQHLTGRAPFRGLELAVGPGVFVPRPETEAVAQVAIDEAKRRAAAGRLPMVVDLCTGSGAIALAVAAEVPAARVHAVELDPLAHAWAERNAREHAATPLTLHLADARSALSELDGRVDIVVSNPPYVPADAVPVDPEVRDHDPRIALYGGGSDGLDVPRGVVLAAARLLAPGGLLVMEHADVQAEAVRRLTTASGGFTEVSTRADLGGRDRMVVARRASDVAHSPS